MLLAIGLICCLLMSNILAGAAPRPPRPTAGIGVLEVRAFPTTTTLDATVISLLREPGLGLMQKVLAGSAQLLFPVFGVSNCAILMAVTERRGEWLRIVFDDAGREGWVKLERPWNYAPWDEYLKGRSAKLLPGLSKNFYRLLTEPADRAGVIATMTPTTEFRLIAIDNDWAQVLVDQVSIGWLRWRDHDRRFMVAVSPGIGAQKH